MLTSYAVSSGRKSKGLGISKRMRTAGPVRGIGRGSGTVNPSAGENTLLGKSSVGARIVIKAFVSAVGKTVTTVTAGTKIGIGIVMLGMRLQET